MTLIQSSSNLSVTHYQTVFTDTHSFLPFQIAIFSHRVSTGPRSDGARFCDGDLGGGHTECSSLGLHRLTPKFSRDPGQALVNLSPGGRAQMCGIVSEVGGAWMRAG